MEHGAEVVQHAEHGALEGVLVLLLFSVAAVILLKRVQMPPIIGYLLVGIITGPYALGLVPENEHIHLLAEIGVVFLLFALGLEFSISHLMAMKGTVFGLGSAQVILTTILVGGTVMLMGMDWTAALVIAGAFALSSTAIVIKQLNEQLEMQSRHGRVALGILLFQDLAVVPFLVLIPLLAHPGEGAMWWPILIAVAKGLVALGMMLLMGHYLMRPLLHHVAALHSSELFTLTVLLLALAAAYFTDMLGLSLALGAFLAGMMLSETEYRHQIETDIRPFRDVLMGLFFVTVGLKLDVTALPAIWDQVLLLVLFLLLGKALLIGLLSRVGGYETGVAIRSGLVLAQGGEFGFALLSLALQEKAISSASAQPALAAIVISMLIAPIVIRQNGTIVKRLLKKSYLRRRYEKTKQLARDARNVKAHVIIVGYGRFGQNMKRLLIAEGFDYIALDLNPNLIREARDAGEQVFFGDAAHREILAAAGIHRAKAIVVTLTDDHLTEAIVDAVRSKDKDIPLLVRSRDDVNLERMQQHGASVVVPEVLETSLMMGEQLLMKLGLDMEQVTHRLESMRQHNYREIRSFFHADDETVVHENDDHFHLHSVNLQENSFGVGKTLATLSLNNFEVEVNALRRGRFRGESPALSTELKAGDVLVLQGKQEDLQKAEYRLLVG